MQTALRLIAAVGAVSAPGLFAQMALVASAHGQALPAPAYASQTAPASALPPPPYAAAERAGAVQAARYPGQQPAAYGGEQGFDRYGGGGSHPRVQAAAAPAAAAYQGPHLAWGGKVAVAAPQTSVQPAAYAPRQAAPAQSPPPGWSFVPPIGPRPAGPALPASIYDPPAPAAASARAVAANTQAPMVQATNTQTGPRHYSVDRDYGVQPDPIPLPPQFFGNTADMSKPETDDPLHRTTTADGKTRNALQPSDGQ